MNLNCVISDKSQPLGKRKINTNLTLFGEKEVFGKIFVNKNKRFNE